MPKKKLLLFTCNLHFTKLLFAKLKVILGGRHLLRYHRPFYIFLTFSPMLTWISCSCSNPCIVVLPLILLFFFFTVVPYIYKMAVTNLWMQVSAPLETMHTLNETTAQYYWWKTSSIRPQHFVKYASGNQKTPAAKQFNDSTFESKPSKRKQEHMPSSYATLARSRRHLFH